MQKHVLECARIAFLNTFAVFFNNSAIDSLFGRWGEGMERRIGQGLRAGTEKNDE